MRVLLATEGTYPYHYGGVSTWCDMLVRRIDEVEFTIFAVAMNPFVRSRFELPPSVARVVTVPLWGTQDPSEQKEQLPFSEIFLQKQRTTAEVIERSFLPDFLTFLDEMRRDAAHPQLLGNAFAAMHRHFSVYDYRQTFKSSLVWEAFRTYLQEAAAAGIWPQPSVFDAVQALGWIYHFLTVLNTEIPEVDIVHSSAAAFCGLAGVVAKVEYGTPYLLTEHGVYLREQYLSIGRSSMSRFAKRFLLATVRTVVRTNIAYADKVAPVCSFNARWERLLGARKEQISVVYNGVLPQVFRPREVAPEPGRPLRLISIARSDPNKDIETLLRAMAIVHRHFPDVTLGVYGAVSVPEYHEQMLSLRAELGLADTVEIGGHSENVADLYRQADVLVQSSVSEAFPYAVIEGMMSALPVVATDVGGTAEAIGDSGILVPSRDPARLAVAIILLLQDQRLRERLGESARERALTYFTTQRATREYTDLYLGLARPALPAAAAGGGVVRIVGVAASQLVHLERGYALLALGQELAALDQFQRALGLAPNGPAAPTILAQIGELETRLGAVAQGLGHLAGAWLIAQVQSA